MRGSNPSHVDGRLPVQVGSWGGDRGLCRPSRPTGFPRVPRFMSEILCTISDMKSPVSNRRLARRPARGLPSRIRARLRTAPAGHVFTPSDFLEMGARAAVDQALGRLARSGELRRVGRGLYEVPRRHPLLGRDATLRGGHRSRARRNGPPEGPTCRRLRGQRARPYRASSPEASLPDGRRVSSRSRGRTEASTCRHATPRAMATAGRVERTRHPSAPRTWAVARVDQRVLDTLRRRIARRERASFARDARFAPDWIAGILRQLAAENA